MLRQLFLALLTMTPLYASPSPVERIQELLTIQPNHPKVKELGYGDCCMDTNGEAEMLKLLLPNDLVIDVGANVGEWSLKALNAESDIKLHAFEPVPQIFEWLSLNLANHPITCHNLALADKADQREMIYYSIIPALSTLHRRNETEKLANLGPIMVQIKTERLDSFCKENNIEHIDFLKIDTEGAEWEVLQGSSELLKKGAIGIIQFEYGGCYLDAKTTLKQVYSYLRKQHYQIYRITPKTVIHIKKWQPTLENFTYSNYLAVYTPKHQPVSETVSEK